jgi:hypothetical protein
MSCAEGERFIWSMIDFPTGTVKVLPLSWYDKVSADEQYRSPWAALRMLTPNKITDRPINNRKKITRRAIVLILILTLPAKETLPVVKKFPQIQGGSLPKAQ